MRVIALLFLALSVPVSAAAQSRDRQDCESNDTARSIRGCTNIIVSGTATRLERASAYLNRGVSYYEKREFERAIQDLNKAINLNSGIPMAFNVRGTAYFLTGRHGHAIQDFDKAIKLQPDNANTYRNRGVVYRKTGKLERAIADFDKAISLSPKYVDAYFNRGRAYKTKGDRHQAIADFRTVLALDPSNVTAKAALKSLGAGRASSPTDSSASDQSTISETLEKLPDIGGLEKIR
jgi:tetratricopeptide (TPR) repeat protein